MLDTILPLLFINRAAASINVNSRALNQPQAQLVKSRRPDVSSEKTAITAEQEDRRHYSALSEYDEQKGICQQYARSKKVENPRPKPGFKINEVV